MKTIDHISNPPMLRSLPQHVKLLLQHLLLALITWLGLVTAAQAGPTTTTFASSSINPAAVNQATRFYATVSPSTATGTITFRTVPPPSAAPP